jgi:hypothetical protein
MVATKERMSSAQVFSKIEVSMGKAVHSDCQNNVSSNFFQNFYSADDTCQNPK